MPRKEKNVRRIGRTDSQSMIEAVRAVFSGGLSVKCAAFRFKIPRTTLRRYVAKYKEEDIHWDELNDDEFPKMTPNYEVRRIFTNEEEIILCDYLKVYAKLHHGLPPKAARKLAYDLGLANLKVVPNSWIRNRCAGKHWFTAFIKRNTDISLRTPESTALTRAMGFNKPVVQKFYAQLENILSLNPTLGPGNIYNTDEIALTTVQGSGKIAQIVQKQIGQTTSMERGTLVTMCGTINALGNSIPPLLIFPRVHFKEHIIKNAPPGTVGSASASGWMTTEIFLVWMKHFIKHVRPSKENPVLLIMDNHESHISYESIKLAKDKDVIFLTLPPHTSHKLQPLDKCVYGPLKRYYNDACRSWLLNNPGKRISIYEIAELLGHSYYKAFTPRNCVSGFQSTGLHPFNRDVYGDDEYLASAVTDIPITDNVPTADTSDCSIFERSVTPIDHIMISPFPDTSKTTEDQVVEDECNLPTASTKFVSPEIIKPFPKATASKCNTKGRKKKSSTILTDTPELNKIREEFMEKQRKSNLIRKRKVETEVQKKTKVIKKKATQELIETSESESDDMSDLVDSDFGAAENDSDEDGTNCISVKSYILVQFPTKKTIKYYVGQVEEVNPAEDEYVVNFLRKTENKFVFPKVKDESTIHKTDIVIVLPNPLINSQGTNRTRLNNTIQFNFDFSGYQVV